MSTFPPPPPPPPETISQAPHAPRENRAVTKLSMILGVLSLSLSVFTVSVYFYAKALWESNGQPYPGVIPAVDFWGQWKVETKISIYLGATSSRIVPVGGLVMLSSPLAILAIICGLAATILSIFIFNRERAHAPIISMILGIGGVAFSAWLLSWI